MKNWIAALLFLVSWSEYELKPVYEYDKSQKIQIIKLEPDYFTVETVDKSIRLKTKKDIRKFIGSGAEGIERSIFEEFRAPNNHDGMISATADNIYIKEISDRP